MTAVEFLKDYSSRVEPLIEALFQKEIERAGKISKYNASPYEKYLSFMKGGKKVRGALTILGYLAAGGNNETEILKASVAIEIIHSFLLIHDDIIDRDKIRRGKKTVHLQFTDELLKSLKEDEAIHFGESFAIFTGDIGMFLAMRIMAEAEFPSENKLEALKSLSEFLLLTADGELLDVREGFTPDITFEQSYHARILKTAYYTVVMPLTFGARLAGASDERIGSIKGYGEKVGLAFQIQDDILGIFSKEEKIGKEVGVDIFEGKKTLLYIKAVERLGQRNQEVRGSRGFLLKYYGKGKIEKEKIERIKEIFVKTGALEFVKGEALRLTEEGKKFIPKITANRKYQELLAELADFMVQREK